MRRNDEQYFRSCVAQERHLAQLLGYRNIEECYESAGTLWSNMAALPKWTRDWGACGPLLARFDLAVSFDTREEGRLSTITVGAVTVRIDDYPDKDHAVMMATVKAAIHKLEHPASRQPAHPAQASAPH